MRIERPGYFRVIAFVVISDLRIDPQRSANDLPVPKIGEAILLPSAPGTQHLGIRYVVALVCVFQRRPGEPQHRGLTRLRVRSFICNRAASPYDWDCSIVNPG